MRCGRNLVRTFLKYYHFIGAIPLELSSEISHKKRRPNTHRSRSSTRNTYRRPTTNRSQALLHFTDLNINYETESSADEMPYSFRNSFSPRRQFQRFYDKAKETNYKRGTSSVLVRSRTVESPPPATIVVLPEPTLSIIDFNLITLDDIDKASKKYNVKN